MTAFDWYRASGLIFDLLSVKLLYKGSSKELCTEYRINVT